MVYSEFPNKEDKRIQDWKSTKVHTTNKQTNKPTKDDRVKNLP